MLGLPDSVCASLCRGVVICLGIANFYDADGKAYDCLLRHIIKPQQDSQGHRHLIPPSRPARRLSSP